MKFFYSQAHDMMLPTGHRFPGTKYGMLRRLLLDKGILKTEQLHFSPLAKTSELRRAHGAAYISDFESGKLDAKAMRRIGLPWSEQLVHRSRATIGGAIAAIEAALDQGISGQLAGGTHHAHRDFGSGYCVFNDFAVGALHALAHRWVSRVAIIDLDVHQGDGNATILKPLSAVFVFSMHGARNFPFRKARSDLDVALPDGTDDADYLAVLEDQLHAVWAFKPELVLYQAGVDPLKEDRLGRLALTHSGLKARDKMVLTSCAHRGIPVSMAIGGGYTNPIDASVVAYANTYGMAKEIHGF